MDEYIDINIEDEDEEENEEERVYLIIFSNPSFLDKILLTTSIKDKRALSKEDLKYILNQKNKDIPLPQPFKYEYIIELHRKRGMKIFDIIKYLFENKNGYFNINLCEIIVAILEKQNGETLIPFNNKNFSKTNINKRKPTLDFHKMGLSNNDKIFYHNKAFIYNGKDNIFVTIVNNKKVLYNDKEYSLSKITQLIKSEKYLRRPLEYWLSKNETLLDIYNRTMALN